MNHILNKIKNKFSFKSQLDYSKCRLAIDDGVFQDENYQFRKNILDPFSREPFFQIAVSVVNVTNLEVLSIVPYLFIRDGFFILSDFFFKFPDPMDLDIVLIIHENLAGIVPAKWRDKVLFYRFHLSNNSLFKKQDASKVLVKGIVSESFFSNDFFYKQLNNILLEKKVKKFYFYFEFKGHDVFNSQLLKNKDVVTNKVNVLTYICNKVGSSACFVSWEDVKDIISSESLEFLDLNEKMFVLADDYTSNYLVTNGSVPTFKEKRLIAKDEIFLNVSQNHGIVVSSEPKDGIKNLDEELREINKLSENEKVSLYKSNKKYLLMNLCRQKTDDFIWYYD